ncbi:MAG: hypothetical protein JXP34_03535 [Planctomycetes bacterium]|nr:hypothetical protein [Planctomycetota bacterium]
MTCDEATLWVRFARGDRGASDEILEAYELPLLRYFNRLLGSSVAAEELLVRAIEALVVLRGRLPGDLSMRARVFALARELAIDHILRWFEHAADAGLVGAPAAGTGLVDARAGAARNAVRAAFADIPLPAREALCLKLFGELSVAEIASILDAGESRVRGWLRSSLVTLAQRLPSDVQEERDGVR